MEKKPSKKKRDQDKKKTFILVGPLPPPIHGESNALYSIFRAEQLKKLFHVKVINTSRKSIEGAGKFSIAKTANDLINILIFIISVIVNRKKVIYISISQTKLGLLRDCILISIGKTIGRGKIITHLHGNNLGNVIDNTSGIQRKFINSSLKKIDIGIVLGGDLSENYKGLVKRVEVVSNGIPSDFVMRNEINLNKKNNPFTVLYLSNLMAEKGYIELVNAIHLLVEEGYNIKLDLVGAIQNQHEYLQVENFIKENNLEKHITYHGIKQGKAKKDMFLNANVMVLPTKYKIEGQPLSIIEAMAAGLPIISTDKGVIAELIEQCGIIVNSDVHELKESIKRLYVNEEERKALGEMSRLKYEQFYTEEKYIESLIKIFCEVSLEPSYSKENLLAKGVKDV